MKLNVPRQGLPQTFAVLPFQTPCRKRAVEQFHPSSFRRQAGKESQYHVPCRFRVLSLRQSIQPDAMLSELLPARSWFRYHSSLYVHTAPAE